MKSGKAPGIDSIHAEMLKEDIEASTKNSDLPLHDHLDQGHHPS